MRLKRRPRQHDHINIAPLVDVVFLLLIFFMLTFHIREDQAIPLTLPGAASAEPRPAEGLTITLDQTGTILFADQKLTPEETTPDTLSATLADRLRQGPWTPATPITVRADAEAPTGRLVAVLDGVRLAGFTSMGLVTLPLR